MHTFGVVAAIIANNGDIMAAANSFMGLRDGFLKGFTQGKENNNGRAPSMPNGAPQAPKGNLRANNRDGFRQASIAAEQALLAAAGAQG